MLCICVCVYKVAVEYNVAEIPHIPLVHMTISMRLHTLTPREFLFTSYHIYPNHILLWL
jgi:hypothetical protein